jgi:hypothetical protein
MSFMEAQMTGKMWWLSIDGNRGTDYIPDDLFDVESVRAIIEGPEDEDYADKVLALVRDYTENSEAHSAELVMGYGVRSSAPGYMDCTSWSVYTSKREAQSAYAQERRECAGDGDEPIRDRDGRFE